MSARDDYHPRHALADPEGFYDWAFENTVNPRYAQVVGKIAVRYASPEFYFPGGATQEEFYDSIDEDSSVLITFSHHGEKKLQDVSIAAATVFQAPYLMDRLDTVRVWAKNYYLTDRVMGPLIRPLGTVPVSPSITLSKKYRLKASQADIDDMQVALFRHTADHLATPGRVGVIFPPGTKGGETIQIGVGKVLEMSGDTKITVLPVEMVSDTAKDEGENKAKNRPKNCKVVYGETFQTEEGLTAEEYVGKIAGSLIEAGNTVTA
ncbi:hypothetical protein KC950_02175 [Candidatus Saccharibacteria bacterium]|nr:hypothetical protein [Candidatus Saccharibacteria bacterium]